MGEWDNIWEQKIKPEPPQTEISCTAKDMAPYISENPDPTCIHSKSCGMDFCMLGMECKDYRERTDQEGG